MAKESSGTEATNTNGWAFDVPPVFGRITSQHRKKERFGVFVRRGVGTDFPELDLFPCPFGQPGERRWVRETFQQFTECGDVIYKADPDAIKEMRELRFDEHPESFWRSPVAMPRSASRFVIENERIRVERLQAISEEDAIAAGVQIVNDGGTPYGIYGLANSWNRDPRKSYRALWESIHGPGSWDANPLVWVVDARRVEA